MHERKMHNRHFRANADNLASRKERRTNWKCEKKSRTRRQAPNYNQRCSKRIGIGVQQIQTETDVFSCIA